MVMVYLALAMLAAVGAAEFGRRFRRPMMALLAIAVVVFADFLAAPFPVVAIECPAIYATLRDRPERGALAELPLGIGDGFGALTPVDHRMFVCQSIHQRPLVGGVVARLPSNVLPVYQADPLLAGWMRLSEARSGKAESLSLPDSRLAGERLKANGIAFVLLNRQTASPELREHVEHGLPLTLVAEGANRALYVSPSTGAR
jgi:hypothetical protein